MAILIVSNSSNLSKAICRFINYNKSAIVPFIIADFQQFENLWIENLEQIEIMVIDIYKETEEQLISMGIIYGNLFSDNNKKLIWFYTTVGLINKDFAKMLPPNVFNLPSQLTEFLLMLKSPVTIPYELIQIQKYFKSQSVTNSHK